MSKTGVMVCGHGSRDAGAVGEFQAVARGIEQRLPHYDVESGFLEFATPVIRDGLDALRGRGVKKILAIPGMLFAAGHVKNDVPSVLNTYAAQHPDIEIIFGRDLGIDHKLIRAAGERVEQALAAAGGDVPRDETLLVVVGRGASDPDANSNVAKVCRLLWEGLGLGWAETAFSGVAHPSVDVALGRAARLGFGRIIVFPYFLFTGVLVKRILRLTQEAAVKHPKIEFLAAGYLKDHPLTIETLIERVHEIGEGANNMNCQLCKYRERVIGYEGDVGKAQAGHHHHVRGIGTGTAAAAGHRHGRKSGGGHAQP